MKRAPYPTLLIAAACLLTFAARPLAALEPELKSIRLKIGTREEAPLKVEPGGTVVIRAGGLNVEFRQHEIAAMRDGKEIWKARAPEGRVIQHLADDQETLYLQWWIQTKDANQRNQYKPDGSAVVRRLALKDGTWQVPLLVAPKAERADTESEPLWRVLPTARGIAVLSGITKQENDLHETNISAYRISFFNEKAERLWSKEVPSAGDIHSPGVGLLSGGGPRYAAAEVNQLSLAGEHLIVCAGASQDLIALELNAGAERWRLSAVWEYERGFIGPSVWQHFISRFGDDGFGDKKKYNPDAEESKQLRKLCRIVGGPMVVPYKDGYRYFVAIAKSRAGFGGYLADCFVYELETNGDPVAIINMPRMIIGSDYRILKDGILWRCEQGAFVKITPSHQSRGMGMGGGGTDCTGRIDWYRQTEARNPNEDEDAWLSTGVAGDPIALSDSCAWLVTDGGSIEKESDKTFRFPLVRLDFNTGAVTKAVLNVPFAGDANLPETNYSRRGKATRTRGPHLMAITGLDLSGDLLRITLGTQAGANVLEFKAPQAPQ